jgi:hypothetical protein
MSNPRYALLLANYAKYDHMTLMLAVIALAIVLIGWAMLQARGRFDRLLRDIYFGFILWGFVGAIGGTAIVLILGGNS